MNHFQRPLVRVFIQLVLQFAVITPWCQLVNAGEVTAVSIPGGSHPCSAKVDGSGTIHVVTNSPGGPRYLKSDDEGHTFTTPIPIVDVTSLEPGLEFTVWDMAVSSQGDVHVALGTNAWKLKRPQEEWGCFYTKLPSGAKSFSPVRNINRKPSEGFSLAVNESGRVSVCWLADRLYANVSEDGGKTFAGTVEIDPTSDPCNCCTTSCTYGADGRLAVLYREETDNARDMHLILWNQESGNVARTQISRKTWKIDACPMTYYSIVPNRDGYLAVWPTKGQIFFTKMDSDGVPRSASDIPTNGKAGMRTGVTSLVARDGSVIVAWKIDGQLGWQEFDSGDRPKGRPGSAASPGTGVAGVVTTGGTVLLFQ